MTMAATGCMPRPTSTISRFGSRASAWRLSDTAIGPDEAKRLDIRLEPGVTFWAKVVDSLTGKTVPNVRLWHWQHPGVEGRPDKDGYVAVRDMIPGAFRFQVDAPGYARWWSDQAASEWSRRQISESGWQRNFDQIDFDLERGMRPVTITLEPAVTVTGRVLDPDGKPVAGATVAPALTGTGNSLTGDTRFSFESKQDGTFTMLLPASGGCDTTWSPMTASTVNGGIGPTAFCRRCAPSRARPSAASSCG